MNETTCRRCGKFQERGERFDETLAGVQCRRCSGEIRRRDVLGLEVQERTPFDAVNAALSKAHEAQRAKANRLREQPDPKAPAAISVRDFMIEGAGQFFPAPEPGKLVLAKFGVYREIVYSQTPCPAFKLTTGRPIKGPGPRCNCVVMDAMEGEGGMGRPEKCPKHRKETFEELR